MLKEFRDFVFRGNLLDLAVAFILGVAFAAVVNAFTDGIIMAFIAAFFGQPSFDAIEIELGDGRILVGVFLTALVNFLIVAAVLFAVMKAAAAAQRSKVATESEAPSPTDEAILLTEIRDLLRSQGSATPGGAG